MEQFHAIQVPAGQTASAINEYLARNDGWAVDAITTIPVTKIGGDEMQAVITFWREEPVDDASRKFRVLGPGQLQLMLKASGGGPWAEFGPPVDSLRAASTLVNILDQLYAVWKDTGFGPVVGIEGSWNEALAHYEGSDLYLRGPEGLRYELNDETGADLTLKPEDVWMEIHAR